MSPVLDELIKVVGGLPADQQADLLADAQRRAEDIAKMRFLREAIAEAQTSVSEGRYSDVKFEDIRTFISSVGDRAKARVAAA